MIKREITYTYYDDDGNEITDTEVFWFHLSEEEVMEWMSKEKEDLSELLQKYVKQEDKEQLFAFLKKVILDSYGHRESGGRIFEKSPELRKKFENSFAYKALFKEFTMGPNPEEVAAQFINGVFPKVVNQDQPQTKVVEVVSTDKT